MDLLKYDNFIFDFDGTVVDSMPFWISRPSEFVKFKGLEPKDDLDRRVIFFESLEAAELIKNEYNLKGTPEDVYEEMKNWIYEEYRYVPMKAKALDLIKLLYEKKKNLFILSTSVNNLIQPSVEVKNIKKYFVEVFSARSNNLSKENGDAFIHFFDKYNLDKEKTIVFDDSPLVLKKLKELNINAYAIKEDFYKERIDELKSLSLGYYSLEEIYEKTR